MTHTNSLNTLLKRVLLTLGCFAFFATLMPQDADAWRYARRSFRPRLAVSLSGGLTLYDNTYEDQFGTYEDTAFSHGIVGVAAHLWIHPNFSIDLGLDTHFLTDYDRGQSWGYVSLKPGVRARWKIFYLRGALDLAFADSKRSPVLFGFLIGAGIRVPVSRHVRLFSEMDFQYLSGGGHMLPVNFKGGLEVVF